MKRIEKPKLVRVNKLRRIEPVKDCYIQIPNVAHWYFVNEKYYSTNLHLMSKVKAFQMHKKLKKIYHSKFMVIMKSGEFKRVLIKE